MPNRQIFIWLLQLLPHWFRWARLPTGLLPDSLWPCCSGMYYLDKQKMGELIVDQCTNTGNHCTWMVGNEYANCT
jgi:hypothetical protein